MGQGRSIGVAHHAQALFQAGRLGDVSDAALLERSMDLEIDAALREISFTALVERHGPMVLRVCEVVVGNFQEAEDAFQATFLVLAARGSAVDNRRLARTLAARGGRPDFALCSPVRGPAAMLASGPGRLQAEARSIAEPGAQNGLERDEAICIVQTEIARLPKRLRDCVVLCDLQGLTYAQAARQLNLPLGTVQSRLARARNRLRAASVRRGLGPTRPAGHGLRWPEFVALAWQSAMRPHLIERTARICLEFAANYRGQRAVSFLSSTTALVKRGLDMFIWSKLKHGFAARRLPAPRRTGRPLADWRLGSVRSAFDAKTGLSESAEQPGAEAGAGNHRSFGGSGDWRTGPTAALRS